VKYKIITSTVFVTFVLASGCSEQRSEGAASQLVKPNVAALAPVRENFENVTMKFDAPAFINIDGVNDLVTPKAGSTVSVRGDKIMIAGFGVDAIKGEAAAGVVAMIDGKPYVASYGGERPDIARALNNPKYLKSQFYVEVPTGAVVAGIHELKMRVIAADKSGYYESGVMAKLDVK
jgi:hypothetical protein